MDCFAINLSIISNAIYVCISFTCLMKVYRNHKGLFPNNLKIDTVKLNLYLSIYPSIYLPIYLSIYLSTYIYIYIYTQFDCQINYYCLHNYQINYYDFVCVRFEHSVYREPLMISPCSAC